jgi:alkylhydroperoxidase family enzyme
MPQDRDELWRAIESAVLDSPGELPSTTRRAAAGDGEVPVDTSAYVDKVRKHAYRVTDEDVAQLRARGYTEDQLFELTIAASLGAGLARRAAALRAMGGEP